MKLIQKAHAGTVESNDMMITVEPGEIASGIKIELDSIVLAQYGEAILALMKKVLQEQEIEDVHIVAYDRGAMDCTIRARLLTALARSGVALKGGPM